MRKDWGTIGCLDRGKKEELGVKDSKRWRIFWEKRKMILRYQ